MYFLVSTYSWLIIGITVLLSILAFNNNDLIRRFILWPRYMDNPSEYYRFISSGFVHADWNHLLFNMLTFFFFGKYVETNFAMLGKHNMFLVLYLGAIIISSLPAFYKHRNDSYFRSLGASGGVSAILFSFIYSAPWATISIWFLPVPAIIAGIGYIFYSAYMAKQNVDNIGHDAHLWGSVFGFIFTFFFDPSHGNNFLIQLMHPQYNI